MSQLRLGTNPDGTRHVVVLEPAAARRAGFGGSSLGFFSQVVLTHAQRKARGTRQLLPSPTHSEASKGA